MAVFNDKKICIQASLKCHINLQNLVCFSCTKLVLTTSYGSTGGYVPLSGQRKLHPSSFIFNGLMGGLDQYLTQRKTVKNAELITYSK